MSESSTTMEDSQESVASYLETSQEELLTITERLVGIDSQNPPGETKAIIELIEELVDYSQFDSTRVIENTSKPNLVLSLPGTTSKTLLLTGHVDTVPYDEPAWSFDPLGEWDGDRLYGRGTTDMKGPLAAMIQLVRAFGETDTTPPVGLQLAFVSDEETAGAAGLPAVLEANVIDADAALIGEPTCEGGRHSVTVADKGSIWLTLSATGTAAHGSRPAFGENAIDALIHAIQDIRHWLGDIRFAHDRAMAAVVEESVTFYEPLLGEQRAQKLFNRPTVNLGTISGGSAINSVPERAEAKLDIRLPARVDTVTLIDELRRRLQPHAAVDIADINWSRGSLTPIDAPIVEATVESATAVRRPIFRRSATGGGNAKTLRRQGIPTVEFAFGTETAHAVDEYITTTALEDTAEVYGQLPFAYATRK